jgi:hypothetical protein
VLVMPRVQTQIGSIRRRHSGSDRSSVDRLQREDPLRWVGAAQPLGGATAVGLTGVAAKQPRRPAQHWLRPVWATTARGCATLGSGGPDA